MKKQNAIILCEQHISKGVSQGPLALFFVKGGDGHAVLDKNCDVFYIGKDNLFLIGNDFLLLEKKFFYFLV